MCKWISIFSFIFLVCFVAKADHSQSARKVSAKTLHINVGLGIRPPFLIDKRKGLLEGAGPEILTALNSMQNKFHFIAVEIPSKRKVHAVAEGAIDMMMWDNLSWGWDSTKVNASRAILSSHDIYIAANLVNQEQMFFDDFTDKKIAMVIGYHYKFANFETDMDIISGKFNVTVVRTEEASIRMVAANRVDIATVSESALTWYFMQFPGYEEKILKSEKVDSKYTRHFIIPASAPISAKEMDELMHQANTAGLLSPIYEKYGLNKPSIFL